MHRIDPRRPNVGKVSPPAVLPGCDRPVHYEHNGKLYDADGLEIVPGLALDRALTVKEALRAIDGALRAIAVALGGDTAGKPASDPAPVTAALAEALAGLTSPIVSAEPWAGIATLLGGKASATALLPGDDSVKERTGIDLRTWKVDTGLRCQ